MKVKIKKSDLMLIGVFAVSLLNRWLILLLFLYICYRGTKKVEDCIEGLLLIGFRTILNTTIAVDIGGVQVFKWMTIFILGILIFLYCRKRIRYTYIDLFIFMFSLYICSISFFNSSYPTISIFKCVSYSFIFWAILRGIRATKDNVNWLEKIYRYMTFLFLACFLSIPFPFAYYSTAHWFAGITNQSNMFGILAGLYVGILFTRMLVNKPNFFSWVMFFITFGMTWISNSRTGMLSMIISVVIYLAISILKYKRFYYLVVIGSLLLAVIVFGVGDEVIAYINMFIFKGSSLDTIEMYSSNDIFSSREGQLETFLVKFNNNPWFGSGFCVPFVANTVDWAFSFGVLVEPGNIGYAVLGDLGIIGVVIFSLLYGYILVKGFKIEKICLFLSPFTICLGEMVFFSTNNIAIFLYVMFAIYFAVDCKNLIHKE